MKQLLKRVLVALLAMALLMGAALPAAFALEIGSMDVYQRANIWEDSTATMSAGTSIPLTMTIWENGKQYKLTDAVFNSGNTSVASVSMDGLLTALMPGTAQIYMTSARISATYTLTLTVVSATPAAPTVPTSIYFSQKKLTTYTGVQTDMDTLLCAQPLNSLLTNTAVKWKSNKSSVVAVDKNGVITAKKPGSAIITATSGKLKASITVAVKKNKLDNITAKPGLGKVAKNKYGVFLKSLEITSPTTVVAEYYLVFNRPSNYRTKRFVYLTTEITGFDAANNRYVELIDTKLNNVSVSTRGQTVKLFKVTYSGRNVGDTNVRLLDCRGKVNFGWSAKLESKR